uniref:Putative conserved secreted protein n=1 Tax=Aedes albopictus TaxID=7160 RepID=A0A1W7R6Z7_AEDAL
MKGLICVLIVFICVHSWSVGVVVEAKNRNRVQKWQQRTWKARFGNIPRNDWKFGDGAVKGGKSHRKNSYASARFGELSRREMDMLSGREVPNGYSNFRFRFDDPDAFSYAKVRSPARSSNKGAKNSMLNPKTVQNFRMKRSAFRNEDDDDEPEHFSNDLSKRPFVFGSNIYPDDQSEDLSNDVADLDFVRDDETIDFGPPRAGTNQRYTTVEENDPFPHAVPPPNRKNATRTVPYTIIIRYGDKSGVADGEPSIGAATNWRTHAIWLYWLPLLGLLKAL